MVAAGESRRRRVPVDAHEQQFDVKTGEALLDEWSTVTCDSGW